MPRRPHNLKFSRQTTRCTFRQTDPENRSTCITITYRHPQSLSQSCVPEEVRHARPSLTGEQAQEACNRPPTAADHLDIGTLAYGVARPRSLSHGYQDCQAATSMVDESCHGNLRPSRRVDDTALADKVRERHSALWSRMACMCQVGCVQILTTTRLAGRVYSPLALLPGLAIRPGVCRTPYAVCCVLERGVLRRHRSSTEKIRPGTHGARSHRARAMALRHL